MTSGPAVDGTGAIGVVLRDVRCDVNFPAPMNEVFRVEVLVAADGNGAADLADRVEVLDAVALQLVQAVSTGHGAYNVEPSADGKWIIVTNKKAQSVSLVDAQTLTEVAKIPTSKPLPHGVAYSPDGRKIVFTSARDGDLEVYSMNTDGSGATNITHDGTAKRNVDPNWSASGLKIAFTRYNLFGGADIMVVNKGDRPGADRAASHLRAMLTVGAQHDRAMGDDRAAGHA